MLLKLALGLPPSSDENTSPTDIAWAGSHVVAENAALGTVVGGLLTPNEGEVGTFTMVDGSNHLFDVSGDNVIVTGVLDFETATSHNVTIKFTDASGLSITEQFVITVTDVAETEPENPPPTGDVVHDDTFDKPPVVTEVDGAIKLHGKKATGSTGKFIYDIGQALAGSKYTIEYDPDFTLLTQQGKLAMVGFGLKSGNDFHMAGLKGDGSTGLRAYQISGDDLWNQTSGFTTDDAGAAAHGTQAGPNWLRFEVSDNGATYTLRTSADGVSWTDEYTDEVPVPLADVDSPPTFGIAAFFDGTDTGPFSVEISLWQSGFRGVMATNVLNYTVNAGSGTQVTFDSEQFDIGGWHSTSSSTHLVTVPGGVDFVIVDGNLRCDSFASGLNFFFGALLMLTESAIFDGAAGAFGGNNPAQAATGTRSVSTGPVPVTAGQQLSLYFEENATSATTTVVALRTQLSVRAIENFSGAMVKMSADVTGANLTTGTFTLDFDQEIYDRGGWHDNSVNNDQIVVPAGVDFVIVTGNIFFSNATTNELTGLTLLKNGVNNFDGAASSACMVLLANVAHSTKSGPIPVVEGDEFRLLPFTTTDTSVDIESTRTNFSVYAVHDLNGCMVKKSADLTAANLTAAPFQDWNTVVYNEGGNWRTGADSEIVIPEGVRKVVVTSNIRLEAVNSENVGLIVFKNGSSSFPGAAGTLDMSAGTFKASSARSGAIPVLAGDRFQVAVQPAADTSVTVKADRSNFSVYAVEEGGDEPDFQAAHYISVSPGSVAEVTTATFGIGPAGSDRLVVYAFSWADDNLQGSTEVTGVTIGGVTATRAVRASGDNQSANTEIWYAEVPTGTQATATVTLSSPGPTAPGIERFAGEVFVMRGFTATPQDTGTGTTSANVDVQPGDRVIAASIRGPSVSTTHTLSGMHSDWTSTTGGIIAWAFCSKKADATETFTTNMQLNTGNGPKIAMASWRPA